MEEVKGFQGSQDRVKLNLMYQTGVQGKVGAGQASIIFTFPW